MHVLHVLDHSIPLQSGYTFRTRAILNEQRALGWKTTNTPLPNTVKWVNLKLKPSLRKRCKPFPLSSDKYLTLNISLTYLIRKSPR